ncbi:ATP-binding protein [Nitrosococcus wardiae]|uniref:ATP-binding protein n=1 Tax=Nitrosococcus wardiae TaxID=1814290 RepID=A0A4P7BV30_9GAMM|nr:ATP-binding protein [Nitrosococcus wardiae]QBQ53843.1 ATP-binding protein [Nitrosococcus wardiae]
MKNPFKPSEIISDPNEFFGRAHEISALGRLLSQGSVAIQGSFGVGKSSLLSRVLLHMDGFDSGEVCVYKLAVGHGDIDDIEKAARLVLEELVSFDTKSQTLTFGIPKLAQYSSTEAYALFQEGRHLAALNHILEDKAFRTALSNGGYFLIAIDEAEKCAPALARLFRQVITKAQLNGIGNIRFVFAGVSPFVEAMIKEDPGVMRFIYETIDLKPFSMEEARELLDAKFSLVVESTKALGEDVNVDPGVVDRIVQLSGGHPHLLQLLGSHVIEHEHANPDGLLDNSDLVGSLQKICYQQRAPVYDALIHDMRAEARYDAYLELLGLLGGNFPGQIDVGKALEEIDKEDVDWFLSRNILMVTSEHSYEIVDELLRVRVIMDMYEDYDTLEAELISHGELIEEGNVFDQIWGSALRSTRLFAFEYREDEGA